jgi:hypothetical protein
MVVAISEPCLGQPVGQIALSSPLDSIEQHCVNAGFRPRKFGNCTFGTGLPFI